MNHLYRFIAISFAAFLALQTGSALPACAKTVKPKGQGHKFGFGWLKRGNGVHKNGYSKNYHNPKP